MGNIVKWQGYKVRIYIEDTIIILNTIFLSLDNAKENAIYEIHIDMIRRNIISDEPYIVMEETDKVYYVRYRNYVIAIEKYR